MDNSVSYKRLSFNNLVSRLINQLEENKNSNFDFHIPYQDYEIKESFFSARKVLVEQYQTYSTEEINAIFAFCGIPKRCYEISSKAFEKYYTNEYNQEKHYSVYCVVKVNPEAYTHAKNEFSKYLEKGKEYYNDNKDFFVNMCYSVFRNLTYMSGVRNVEEIFIKTGIATVETSLHELTVMFPRWEERFRVSYSAYGRENITDFKTYLIVSYAIMECFDNMRNKCYRYSCNSDIIGRYEALTPYDIHVKDKSILPRFKVLSLMSFDIEFQLKKNDEKPLVKW